MIIVALRTNFELISVFVAITFFDLEESFCSVVSFLLNTNWWLHLLLLLSVYWNHSEKQQFFDYFINKKDESGKSEELNVTKVVSSVTKNISNVELQYVSKEIESSRARSKEYRKDIPKHLKKEIGNHALTYGTASAMKKYSASTQSTKLLELQ